VLVTCNSHRYVSVASPLHHVMQYSGLSYRLQRVSWMINLLSCIGK